MSSRNSTHRAYDIFFVLLCALCAFVVFLSSPAIAEEAAQEIVAKADLVRNPANPFRATSTLTEYKAGQPVSRNVLLIFSKIDPSTHQFFNLVRWIDPPRDAGKMALLGHVLWFYDPSSKTSVRISPQQRLTGQAAIGDVLTANLAVDYTAELKGVETIADATKSERQTWHLDMKAASENATYNRVEYWVEKGSYRPIKAKFYSDSGRLLKVLYYRNFSQRLGSERPGGAVIIDAVDSSLATTVDFSDQKFQDIPDVWFQRDYLPHLNVD